MKLLINISRILAKCIKDLAKNNKLNLMVNPELKAKNWLIQSFELSTNDAVILNVKFTYFKDDLMSYTLEAYDAMTTGKSKIVYIVGNKVVKFYDDIDHVIDMVLNYNPYD